MNKVFFVVNKPIVKCTAYHVGHTKPPYTIGFIPVILVIPVSVDIIKFKIYPLANVGGIPRCPLNSGTFVMSMRHTR